jgi:hypothetical protein
MISVTTHEANIAAGTNTSAAMVSLNVRGEMPLSSAEVA